MKNYETLLDAVSALVRAGYKYDADYERFTRGSWSARIHMFKNGKCRVTSY